MLDSNLLAQLKQYMTKVVSPIEIVATLDDGKKSQDLKSLLTQIAQSSDKITLRTDGQDKRSPSFALQRPDGSAPICFAGIPLGHEFASLVLALLQVGGHPPKVDEETLEQIKNLPGEYHFETYFSLSCQNCPDVVQALNLMAAVNPNIHHVAIDGALYQEEVEEREVMAVPNVFLNGEPFDQGRMELAQILEKLDDNAGERKAAQLEAQAPFDVLVIGGGPAGAGAAIYAARKGLRTGIVAERLGGQVLDTLAIENFISVPYTEGPKLARDLETHIRDYQVEVINNQQASELITAEQVGGYHQVNFVSGGQLKTRSLILATGARWRELGVPGEQKYRNYGVAYCPHCDAPLYKGKDVAVVGGGNSGVEAAIDLAGLVNHVTVLEFQDQLAADTVLQDKLRSLPNVDIITQAQTTQVLGDDRRVTALEYIDRASGETKQIALDGIFVQIGLLPNSEWLGDSLERTQHGEIVIDERAATSVPGVFAAGDVTNVPYKQIVVASGEGIKAALSAFDFLIRNPELAAA